MRVLQVINTLQAGGAETLLCGLVRELRQIGVDSDVFALQQTGVPLESEMEGNAPTRYAGKGSAYSPACVRSLARQLAAGDYDVIHAHLFPTQFWTPLAARMAGVRTPLVTTEHSTSNRRRKGWGRPLDAGMYRSYRSIACISEAVREALEQWAPGVRGKTVVVPNGIDIDRIQRAVAADRHDVVGQNDVPVILSVGRFEAAKDHATLLRALPLVPEAHAVLVGDGSQRQEMERLADALGLSERVHFLGRRDDVPELIGMSDVFVQSSHWEGFGLAAVEAMAGAVPVIASRVPGLADIVEGAGLTFQPGDHQELASCLNSLLSDESARAELGQKGLHRAAGFSLQVSARNYASLYQSVANSR